MMRRVRHTSLILAAFALLCRCPLAADDYPLRGVTHSVDQLEALTQQCKENPTPELLNSTGWLFFLYANESGGAGEFFEKALDSDPRNAWARYGLCVTDEIRGDFTSLLSHSLALCESCPEHPVSLLALLNVRFLFGKIADYNRRVEPILQSLVEERRSGSVQFDAICREILSGISRSRGDAEEVKRLRREGGYVTDWRIVGPFGEFPNLSFFSTWAPERDRALRSRYKVGDEVEKTKPYSSEDDSLRSHWLEMGVHYAETFVRSPRREDAVVRVYSRTPIELSVNNHRVYRKDTVREFPPAVEYVKVRLSEGYNRILLKHVVGGRSLLREGIPYKSLGSGCPMGESGRWFPAVQILPCPSRDAGFSFAASGQRWRQVQQVEHSLHEPKAFRYFSGLARENPDDPLALGACGILQGAQGDVQVAKRFLRAAVKHAPRCGYLNYLLGVIVGGDPSLPTQVRQSEARSRFRSALAAAETFPLARYQLALLDIEDEKELEAIEKLNQCIAESPGYLPWHDSLYGVYEKKKWQDEQRRQLETILALGIETCRPHHIAREYYQRTKQYDKLAETVVRLQKAHVHQDFLAWHYYSTGRDAEAIAEYLKLKAARPRGEGIRSSLIQLYERNKRWVEAERELKEALKLFPKRIALWKQLAELKGYTGRWGAERRTWKRVLKERPADPDARKALRAWGARDMLDEFDILSDPYVHDESIRKKYAGVSSAIIIDLLVEEIYPDCSSRQKTHQMILLNDKKAIDEWGELHVPEEELLELRTIKQDGTVVEPERPEKGKAEISMGGLQEGDFIEYNYITGTWSHGRRLKRYLGERFFFQSVDYPMELSRYVVIVPKDMRLTYEQVNFSDPPSVRRKGNKRIYKWEARNVPAIPNEPRAAAETEFLPFVRVGVNYDEDAEILQYQDNNLGMPSITDEIEETVAEILADCPGDTESRARAIYAFVNKEVRGVSGLAHLSRSASATLADRHGDRLALAKAMLDVAGIESRMLVVRPELRHASKVFPGSFSYSLLGIPGTDGQYVHFLDFNNRYFPFGYVRSSLQGGAAVPLQDFSLPDFGLGDDKAKLYRNLFAVPRLPIAANRQERTLKASIGADASINGVEVQQYVGDDGASLRGALMTAEAYQVREFIERLANESFRAAALTSHKVHDLANPEKPLRIEYGFRAPNFARIVGKEMLLDQWLPPLRVGGRFAALDVRKSPLEVGGTFNTRFRGVLRIPAGAEVTAIPAPLDLETDFGFCHLRVAERSGEIHIDSEFHLKAQRISPEEYPRFVEFCRAVDAAERKEIRIRLQP